MAHGTSKLKQRKKVEGNQANRKQLDAVSADLSHSAGSGDGEGRKPLKLLVVLITIAAVALSVYAICAPGGFLEQSMDVSSAVENTQTKSIVSEESEVILTPLEQKRALTTEQDLRNEGDDYHRTASGEPDKLETKDSDERRSSSGQPRQRVGAAVNSVITPSTTTSGQDDKGEITQHKRSEIELSEQRRPEEDASEISFRPNDEPAIVFKNQEQLRGVELEVSTKSVLHSENSQPSGKSHKTEATSRDEIDESNGDSESRNPSKTPVFIPTIQKRIVPKKVFIDGRRIPPVELLAQKPNNSSVRVYLFNDLLSTEECDSLRKAHEKHVSQSSKVDPIICFDSIHTLRKHLSNVNKSKVKVSPSDFTPGTTCLNATFSSKLKIWLNANWSYSTAFYPGESKFSLIMAQRLKDAMGLMPENGGKFQITSYPLNVGYKGHTDCTVESTDNRDRVATVLVYLETVNEGGETEFPELGIWVKPRKGRALLWNNMDENGRCEPLSIHQAAKVKDGHKYILQRWYYYESFGALGKRPPEPTLPARTQGQPRVTCDEYEHGSCRWYDEWNYEHIIEYNRKKHSLA